MAKKQSAYLASLLADDAEPLAAAPDTAAPPVRAEESEAPAPSAPPRPVERATGRAGLSLLGRENALARVASGEVRQVTQLLLDPARVKCWSGNARIQTQLNEQNCRDLIDSIVAEGGQKVPAVVRHLHGHDGYDYELIAGTRRHFAISWLRANSYPDMKLLAQVADLDDEAAFRLADIENRARKDISDIERAKNYAEAIELHYGGKAVRMAERLHLSKGWLSKMLKAATLPDVVLAAFASLSDLTLNPAYKLAVAMDDKLRAKAIRKEAEAIAADQQRARDEGRQAINGASVMARLMAATASAAPELSEVNYSVSGRLGRPILSVKSINRQGVTLHLPSASGATDEEIAEAIKQLLASLRHNGVTVQ
jgi:ParB family chromosome partitioning protein